MRNKSNRNLVDFFEELEYCLLDSLKSNRQLTLEELKLIKEREFFEWKEKSLNVIIKFLDFNWSINDDYMTELNLRILLSEGNEFYPTPILDSQGIIHHNVRTRELKALRERLIEFREFVENNIEQMWNLIQESEKLEDLPIIPT